MAERKLASIKRVDRVSPIQGADKIEVVTIGGWNVVVRKDENLKAGDKVVFFEIDSFLPFREPYMFLHKSSYKKHADGSEGFRLRSVNMRGQLSQGLVMPLPALAVAVDGIVSMPVGADLTDALGVKLYEPVVPSSLNGEPVGGFPSFIRKTDQERIQNLTGYFETWKGLEFEVTEKIDGTSTTFYLNEGTFGVCSRNLELAETSTNVHWQVANKLGIKAALQDTGMNVAVQGELAGPGIGGGAGGNPLGIAGRKFFVFDIWDIDNRYHLTPVERVNMFGALQASCNGLEHVPIIETSMRLFQEHPVIDDILMFANGVSRVNPAMMREGLVFKSTSRVNGEITSFKVLNNDYLLAHDG